MVNELELWLKKKSEEGLRLQGHSFFSFRFEACTPREREYFVYSDFDRSKGISFDYHMAKQRFKCPKSHLNKSSNTIFEADIGKIDAEYYRVKQLRNMHYLRHYLILSMFFLLLLGGAVYIAFRNRIFIAFLPVCAVPFVYAFISFLIIKKASIKLSKSI